MIKKAKKFLLEIISFGSPRAIIFNLSFIFLILLIFPIGEIEHSPFKCIFKNYLLPFIYNNNCPTTGIFANCECPACGLTRGLSLFLHGQFKQAWQINKLTYPLFISMVIILGINIKKLIRHPKQRD